MKKNRRDWKTLNAIDATLIFDYIEKRLCIHFLDCVLAVVFTEM